MKTGLFWSLIIASALSYSFAAQAVDCDELAQYVENQIKKSHEVVAYKSLFLREMRIQRYSDAPHVWFQSEPCERKWSDPSFIFRDELPRKMSELPDALRQLEKYETALKRCTQTATQRCPYAKKIIFKIHTQKILNSKCTDLYTQSIKDNNDHWATERLAAEKREVFDAYIDDSKR